MSNRRNALPYTQASAVSIRGTTHVRNDDRFTILDGSRIEVRDARRGAIFAVADGVSSFRDGHRAAEVTCETLARFFTSARPASEDLLLDLVESADAEVRMTIGGACTLAGIWLVGRRVRVFSLGDSSVYRIRGTQLRRLTPLQTRNGLTTYVGMGQTVRPCVTLDTHPLLAGDLFLLFSDGLMRAIGGEEDLRRLVLRAAGAPSAIEEVSRLLEQSEHPDDATLIVAEVIALEASPAQVRAMLRDGASPETRHV